MLKISKIIGILIALMLFVTPVLAASTPGQWTMAGKDLNNSHFQANTSLSAQKVGGLQVQWSFTTGGDVSATPSVDVNNIYFPDWGGNLWAVNRVTGQAVWRSQISGYTGLVANPAYNITADISRDTPTIAGNLLILGDQAGYHGGQQGYVMAVNKNTGALVWRTAVGSVFTIVTQSPVVDNNTVYVGVASAEEAYEGFIPNYPCCSFRDSFYALDLTTGAIKWQTYMAPAGYSGNSVWGSTPVIDHKRNSVYITTGNNYSVPASVQDCVAAAGNDANAVKACIAPDNYTDSVLSLDLNDGHVKWATAGIPYDSFNLDCFPTLLPPGYIVNPQNCPAPAGPDYDFALGAMLYNKNGQDFLAAGQKSGVFWAFNPDNGNVIWKVQAAPGGVGGGLEWGSSTDGKSIFFASANTLHRAWVVNGATITSGNWGALDAATGAILWQTPDPSGFATDPGAVTSINGVVFACSMDPSGKMYAMDSATGKILWNYASGGSCNSAPAVAGGNVYWGSGYSNFGGGTGNNKLFAFSVK